MNTCEVSKYLSLPTIETVGSSGRTAENLGPLSNQTDCHRITMWVNHPLTGWAMNELSSMEVTCLKGTVHLQFAHNNEIIELTTGATATVSSLTAYCWRVVSKDVILLVCSTPHWTPNQYVLLPEDW